VLVIPLFTSTFILPPLLSLSPPVSLGGLDASISALATLMLSVTIQQQNVTASNEDKDKFVINNHDRTIISEKQGIRGNEGSVTNEEDSHFNSNDNTNREDRIKCNSHHTC
jgi:hypothetical protein